MLEQAGIGVDDGAKRAESMSERDRERWNARYEGGAYGERTHPAVLLESWVEAAPRGRALDVACGAGRNALYLAECGFEVVGLDISQAALAQGAQRAKAAGLTITWLEHDLDQPIPDAQTYALITVIRYADTKLVPLLIERLQPGGLLLVEAHLGGELFTSDVGGPGSDRFRLAPGELAAACGRLEVLHYAEEQIADPDGRLMALAQCVGRRAD